MLRHVLEDILPSINAPIHQVMDCIKHLTLEAGDDMASHMLVSPFIDFCKSDPDRPEEILAIAIEDIDDEFDFVSPAIISGSTINLDYYVSKAILLAKNAKPIISQRAIFAIGRINYNNQTELTQAALEAVVFVSERASIDDVRLLPTSLRTFIALFQQDASCKDAILKIYQTTPINRK